MTLTRLLPITHRAVLVLLLALVPAATHATIGAMATPAALLAAIPPRPATALTGSELVARVATLSEAERGQILLDQILQGNVPSFLRRLKPVEMEVPDPSGRPLRAVIWVMPDYLAVGSDEDFVRVPLSLDAALAVARRFGCTLPTRKMVDSIYHQSERKLCPQPMPAGAAMTSVAYLWAHNRTIGDQLRGVALGTLVAGDKKDLVLTPRLFSRPGKVAIYGWHREDGKPIQPLSTVHEARYADYSHGIRLVSDTVVVDGQPRSVFDVLEDARLASLVSDEGVDDNARRILGPDSIPATLRNALTD